MTIQLENPVAAFTDKIARPFEDAAPIVRKIASLYEASNKQLGTDQKTLSATFSGLGANAFTDMINKQINWVNGIHDHINDLAGFYETCASDVRAAMSGVEQATEPVMDVVQWVFDRLTPDIVVKQGEDAVHAVFDDMRAQLHREMSDASGFFGSIIHLHFGTALHDAVDGVKGLAHLGGDVIAMVGAVEPILCQWAANIYQAVNWLLNKLGSWILAAEDWLFGLSDIADSTVVFMDPNSTNEEKGMAGGMLALNVVMDIGMLIPGADVFALAGKGAFKLLEKFGLKELADGILKKLVEKITENVAAQIVKDITDQFTKKLATKFSDIIVKQMLERDLTKGIFAKLQGQLENVMLPRIQAIIDDYMAGKITKAEAQALLKEMEDLAGKYDFDQIKTLLQFPDLLSNEGKSFVYPNGHTSIAHVIAQHIGKDDAFLQARLPAGNPTRDVVISTFDNQAIAQKAIDNAIANEATDPAFKQFLKTARPGSRFPIDYDTGGKIGFGWKKEPSGVVSKVPSLTKVRVIVMIGSDGKPFILTAFPTS